MLRLNEMDYPNHPQALESPSRNQAITLIEKWMPTKEITKALRVRLTGEEEKRLAKQGGGYGCCHLDAPAQ
jgi:hypothetical protein